MIIGKVGCGKSTVIKLLMNLYTPQSGKVTIGQTNIQDIDPIDLRKIMGVVPQESFLFMGSVQDNIVIGEQFVLDEEVLDAAKAAGVHDFIGKHEAGYDFLIGERGEGLSGGERQSISLARALLKKPSLLILDEPTASIDRQTEHHFLKNMKKILQDETLVLITHTATPLSLVDRVIVINDGKIESDTDSTTFLQNKKGNIDEV